MDPVQTITTAAAASDRWLFLAALFVLGAFGAFAMRWLVSTYSATVAKLSEVIERNSEALRNVGEAVKHCRRKTELPE